MPIINGPYSDDIDGGRRYKASKALRRLQRMFTLEKKLQRFEEAFLRKRASEDELEVFAETYLIDSYNSGRDEI